MVSAMHASQGCAAADTAQARALVERLMFGFVGSQALFACHRLGLFDHLDEHGPSSCPDIAAALGLPAQALERLLIGAACLGLVGKEGASYFLPASLASCLASRGPDYLGDRFAHYHQVSYPLFGGLEAAVREDRPQWGRLGLSGGGDDLYADFVYAHPQATREFLDTMWASGYADSVDLCARHSFADARALVDLGGATGSFAIAALQANPELRAVVMDLAPVEPHAIAAFAAHGCAGRARFHEGDMFEDPLPPGDLYAIGYVLSDWEDARCTALIAAVHAALPPGGRIAILEKFFDEDKTGPFLTAMLNLVMLLEMKGRHRTASEYAGWLERAGFRGVTLVRSRGEKHMLVASKASEAGP